MFSILLLLFIPNNNPPVPRPSSRKTSANREGYPFVCSGLIWSCLAWSCNKIRPPITISTSQSSRQRRFIVVGNSAKKEEQEKRKRTDLISKRGQRTKNIVGEISDHPPILFFSSFLPNDSSHHHDKNFPRSTAAFDSSYFWSGGISSRGTPCSAS
ncbi:hypothetical protein ACHAXS_001756 [Conticribra weissflogii]